MKTFLGKLKGLFDWAVPKMRLSDQSEKLLPESQLLLVDISIFLYSLLLWWVVAVVATLLGFLSYNGWTGNPPAVVVALAFGVLGGFIALYRRLPNLNEKELRLLNSSRLFTALTPLIGGLLAGILYVIFIAELVKSELFPAFSFSGTIAANSDHVLSFKDIFEVHANDARDYAKLIIWSFIAGLNEQLVTDMLGRLQKAVGGTNDGGGGASPTPATPEDQAPGEPAQAEIPVRKTES